jgi:hypothetical protein
LKVKGRADASHAKEVKGERLLAVMLNGCVFSDVWYVILSLFPLSPLARLILLLLPRC